MTQLQPYLIEKCIHLQHNDSLLNPPKDYF